MVCKQLTGPVLIYLPQDKLEAGATIAPVIIASDKTHLSTFSGDKKAWPVYLTLGNINKSTRRKPSARATVLLGYIPVTKLECFTKVKRAQAGYQVFHDCMAKLLAPLQAAGREGTDILCADGLIRHVFPILAAYVADHPEQCLVACTGEKRCPRCVAGYHNIGEPLQSAWRDQTSTIKAMTDKARGISSIQFEAQGLRGVKPFWENLPYCDIFSSFTPDILHQLHKGVFKDHIVAWATECLNGGPNEVDQRFCTMPPGNELRHFKKGISLVSQWTGTEYKNMEKVFLGVLAGQAEPGLIRVVRATLDFIYYAHFQSHTMDSLQHLDAAWIAFHQNKHYFLDKKIRTHFNIPKIHSMEHYIASIISRGSADGYNSEHPERLHIDFVKVAYRASNKREYIQQMTVWLRRRDACHRFSQYLNWASPIESTHHKIDPCHDDDDDDDQDNNNDYHSNDQNNYSDQALGSSYSIAQTSPFTLPISTIVSEFGALNFIHCLSDFLRSSSSTSACIPPLRPDLKLPVFKQFTIHIQPVPQVTQDVTRDVVHARRGVPRNGLTAAKSSRFDPVLAREQARTYDNDSSHCDVLQGQSPFTSKFIDINTCVCVMQDCLLLMCASSSVSLASLARLVSRLLTSNGLLHLV